MDTDKLAQLVADKVREDMPKLIGLWRAQKCADYLDESYKTFMNKTRYLPGFPKPVPMEGHPRWVSSEVIKYATGRR